MRDDKYSAEQIGAYGASEQPAIAARMKPHLRMTEIGAGCALVGVVCAVAALVRFPSFSDNGASGAGWAVAALVGAVMMLAVCAIQVVVWRRAMSSWRGLEIQDLFGEARLSWVAHLISYLAVLVTLLGSIAGSSYATWSATSAVLLGLALLFVLAAQVLSGVQFLRPSGPPGTLPAHMRRLIERSQQREDNRVR